MICLTLLRPANPLSTFSIFHLFHDPLFTQQCCYPLQNSPLYGYWFRAVKDGTHYLSFYKVWEYKLKTGVDSRWDVNTLDSPWVHTSLPLPAQESADDIVGIIEGLRRDDARAERIGREGDREKWVGSLIAGVISAVREGRTRGMVEGGAHG